MQQVKAQLAMSEPLYRPHGQQSNMATLPALPPASSGTVAAPHQPGFLSPLLPSAPGQLPGAHPPYGAFGTPLAIPPGYMLVPAPGAVQVRLMTCASLIYVLLCQCCDVDPQVKPCI